MQSVKGSGGLGHLRGSEAVIQVGLQVASEPQAAEGDSDCKTFQVLGLPLWNSSPTGLHLHILGSWAQNAPFAVWKGF